MGKDFMEEVEHHINHHKNVLYLDWDQTMKLGRHKIHGLKRGSTVETDISTVSASRQQPPATPTLQNLSLTEVPVMSDVPSVSEGPKKRMRKRKSGGVRHQKRDTYIRVVEDVLAVIE
jgi:hypothetical protein